MLRKSIISFFAVAAFAAAVFAQSAPVTGKVELKKADGSVVPLEGALVEVFRTDIKSAGPADKTDKKGQFSFAGLQLGATFVISISAPGATPTYLPGIKAGAENLKFTLDEGDGRRLTPDEVRQAASQPASGGGGELTAEQKKQQAEEQKKRAEIEARNANIVKETEIIKASLEAGNAAVNQKNWDLAVAKYNEGIDANPTFAGSAPVLMNNKATALRSRATATYNANSRSTDATAKLEAFKAVKADLGDAVDMNHKAWTILQNAPAGEISDPKIKELQLATSLSGASDAFRLMAQTGQVDDTKLDVAKAMVPAYLNIETDAARKEQAKLILGDLYRVVGDADNAIAEYRKVVETSPDNLDAMAGLGLSLVNAGYMDTENAKGNNDKALADAGKAKLQEGSNYLQKYASAAPDGHKYKDDALGLIESLKTDQKIAPQKVAPSKRRGN